MPGHSFRLTLSALFTALGILLPILFHAVGLGSVFLPMYWPVAASGFFLPLAFSLAVAVLTPILSFLWTGMPPVSPPVLYAMVPEMMVLAACIRILFRRFRLHPAAALAVGLVLSRTALFLGARCLGPAIGLPPSFASIGAIALGLPGAASMLVCIPILVMRLDPGAGNRKAPGGGKRDPSGRSGRRDGTRSGPTVPERHRDYFNRIAPEWETLMPPEPRLREFFTRFGIRPGDRVLDVGAGTGRTSAVLRGLVGTRGMVVVQDVACRMLIQARVRHRGRTMAFCCSDAQHLPVPNRTFDTIVCYSAFPHFKDKPGALREMRRVLRPNGKLLILHSCSHAALNAFHASLHGPVSRDILPSPESMRRLMAKAGLRAVACEESDDLYWAEAERPE